MKKIVPVFMACLIFCSVGGTTVLAAVPPDNGGIVSPCYLYTNQAYSNLSISGGVASCKSTVYGISGTTTKIVVTQTLQVKDGMSWRRITDWSETFNSWYCSYPNSFSPIAEPTVLKQLQRSTRARPTKLLLFTVRKFRNNLHSMLFCREAW